MLIILYIRRSSDVEEIHIYSICTCTALSGSLTCTRGMLRILASLIWMNLVFFAISLLLSQNIYPSCWPECSSFKTVLHLQYFRDAWMKSSFFYPALARKRLRRLERMCAGVSGLWWLWNKEATSASSIWRLSWRHCWRGSSRSTHQVVSPHPLARQRGSASAYNDSCFFLRRDRVGAEAHGVLRPVQRHSGLVKRSWGLHRRGTCCPCHHLAGSEGEGLSDSASPYSLLPLPCFCTAYDTHHGGMHHSVLQPW